MDETQLNELYNKWFSKNYNFLLREIKNNIANGIMGGYAEDLLHIVIEGLMSKPYNMRLQMYQDSKIGNWVLKACAFQIKSGTSPFYNQLRKYYDRNYKQSNEFEYGWYSETQIHDESLYDCFRRVLTDECNWYEQKLIDLKYYQNYTYTQLNEEFGLPLSTLKAEYNRVFEIIRNKCKYCDK